MKTAVIIKAFDWGIQAGQISISEAKKLRAIPSWVTGFLIKEDDDSITLAHHWFEYPIEDDVRYITTIPKSCVLWRKDYSVEG